MKSRKNFKKKNANYRKDEEPIRIREKKRRPKKEGKYSIYTMIEEEEAFDFQLPSEEEEG